MTTGSEEGGEREGEEGEEGEGEGGKKGSERSRKVDRESGGSDDNDSSLGEKCKKLDILIVYHVIDFCCFGFLEHLSRSPSLHKIMYKILKSQATKSRLQTMNNVVCII